MIDEVQLRQTLSQALQDCACDPKEILGVFDAVVEDQKKGQEDLREKLSDYLSHT